MNGFGSSKLRFYAVILFLVLGACSDPEDGGVTPGPGASDANRDTPRADAEGDTSTLVDAENDIVETPDVVLDTNDAMADVTVDVVDISREDWTEGVTSCDELPRCIDADTREYCVDGAPYIVPCPDDTACSDETSDCEDIICSEEDMSCVDDRTLEVCVDNGTRLEDQYCDPYLCQDDRCSGVCMEDEIICLNERDYEICRGGVFVPDSCPIDEFGTTCFEGACRTLCDLAEIESNYFGCVFWAVDLDNIVDISGEGPGAAGVAVAISNSSDLLATIDIETIEGVFIDDAVLEPGAVETFVLPRRDQIGTRIAPDAFRISSTVPVMAYQFNPLVRDWSSSTDASLLLPEGALGETYRMMNYPAQGANQRGFVTIIGTSSGPVSVSVTVTGNTIEGVDYRGSAHPFEIRTVPALETGETLTRSLQPFDVWQLESGRDADLTGSFIRADGPVAVFGGNRCANIPTGVPRCDHLEHQLLPIGTWGQSFVATPSPQRDVEVTVFRVIAEQSDTWLETTPVVEGTPRSLDAGEVFEFETTEPVQLNTTAPAMVGQFMVGADAGAGGIGDPSFTVLPPARQFRDQYLFLVPEGYATDTVTIVRSPGIDVFLNDVLITTPFVGVAGGDFEVGYIDVDDGVYSAHSDGSFGILVSGFDDDVSYAYPGGLELTKRLGEPAPDATGLCSDGGWRGQLCGTGELGLCSTGLTTCTPATTCRPLVVSRDEVCNGLDDDCDGEIDNGSVCSFGPRFRGTIPGITRIEAIEGDSLNFIVDVTYTGTEELEIRWYIDSIDDGVIPVAYGTSLIWEILPMEAGVHQVIVEATDGAKTAEHRWLVHVHDSPTNSATLWGRVTDMEGLPLIGAPIGTLLPEGLRTHTDFRGLFAFVLDPGSYDLMVATYSETTIGYPTGNWMFGETVELGTVDIRRDAVVPIGRVWGQVVDWNDDPASSVSLWFYNSDYSACQSCYGSEYTESDGMYEMLLYQGDYNASVTPPGIPSFTETVEVGLDTEKNFRIAGPVDVVVTLYDMRDTDEPDLFCDPPSGAETRYRCEVPFECLFFQNTEGYVYGCSPGDSGDVSVQLTPGTYSISLSSSSVPHIGNGSLGLSSITIGDDTVGPVIRELEIPNVNITGYVTGTGSGVADGPLEDVDILFDGSCGNCDNTVVTNADGSYEVDVLASNYRMRLSPPHDSYWASFVTPISAVPISGADMTDYNLVFSGPVHDVAGFLEDPFGNRLENTIIRIYNYDASDATMRTEANGAFDFRVVPGTYTISIDTWNWFSPYQPPGLPYHFPEGQVDMWFSGGAVESDINFPDGAELIVPLSELSGTVRDADGGSGEPNVELAFTCPNWNCYYCANEATTSADLGTLGQYDVVLYRAHHEGGNVFTETYDADVRPPPGLPSGWIGGIPFDEVYETRDINLGSFVE